MRRSYWFVGLWLMAWALPVLTAGRVEAASGDAEGTYTVTLTKIEMSGDGGATYLTLFSGSSDINIASASAGAAVAGLVSGVGVPPGSYNRIRVTLGSTLRIKGYVNNTGDGTTLYTNGGTDGNGFSGIVGLDNTTSGTYSISTFTIDAGSRTQQLSVSIAIPSGGASGTVRVSFNTSGVITQSGGTPSIREPSVSVTYVSG